MSLSPAKLVVCLVVVAPWALPAHGQTVAAHAGLPWKGPGTCVQCHQAQATEVHGSAHYQWEGMAPYSVDGPAVQGKKRTALNSYCINILGNWGACGSCHVGLGAQPLPTADTAQLANIDCLMCHNDRYRRKKDPATGLFVPDTVAMAPLGLQNMDQALQTVQASPTRAACLQCHAKGGGGDNFKRGDLSVAHGTTGDRAFDVHMSKTGGNFPCQRCHTVSEHRFAGRGSDLRQTDLDVAMTCSTSSCHPGKASMSSGHPSEEISRHTSRVACQTCHVGRASARNATDTTASEATEMSRDWAKPMWDAAKARWEPTVGLFNNIKPVYRFWNRYSDNYSLEEVAVLDPKTANYPTSRPLGAVSDTAVGTKLYPFKYKKAYQPFATTRGVLIPLDTRVYFAGAGLTAATQAGLVNLGYDSTDPWKMVTTDTYQLLTHEIAPKAQALTCSNCHGRAASQMSLKTMGYGLKGQASVVCVQCHEPKEERFTYVKMHDKHVKDKKFDCSLCHSFTRPERGLRTQIVRTN